MNQIFKHYKGNYYRVINVAHHTETQEKMVVYEQLYESEYPKGYIWTRPKEMFDEKIIYCNKVIPRFEKVEDILN